MTAGPLKPTFPKISIIVPTLNAEALIGNCLESITAQTYPRDCCEIIVADALSKDRTREIASQFGSVILDDHGRNMEEGKRLAFARAQGEFIAFVDADNELTHPDYLELAVRALEKYPLAIGVESYYPPSPKMSSFCAYLTHLLHISDPISWLLSRNPVLVARDAETERWTLPGCSLAYPLGANGFVFRRTDLESVRATEHFQDTHVALHLMRSGRREWLRIRGRGVHHYYIQTLWRFVQKRRRAVVHFLRVQESAQTNWMREKPPIPLWLAGVYCITLAGPLWHTLRGVVRDRDARWFWHIPACVCSVLGNAWGVWTYKQRGQEKNLIANLQVKQNLETVKASSTPPAHAPPARLPRLICFVNGIYGEGIGGGDVYFYFIAHAAMAAGYPIHFFGGHTFKKYLDRNQLPPNLTLTDDGPGQLGNVNRLAGQFRLLWDFGRRLAGTLRHLSEVKPGDISYAMSDYWFDTIPLIRCRARNKILYLGMIAPTFWEVVSKGRADVTTTRLASLYYWMSQQLSLRWFRRCRGGIVTYSHPEMRAYLLRFGYEESRLVYVPNGSDVAIADSVPEQVKQFDLAWVGRVHPQKGIDDLLATLVWLKDRLPDFRAVIIGKSKDALEPLVERLGLAGHVVFSGLVPEGEKFRLLKSSRVFVMPSHYESWGIVMAEALAAAVPVVAYKLDCYPSVFGDFVRYVKPFDCEAFQRAVEDEIQNQRAGRSYLDHLDLKHFKQMISWDTAAGKFQAALDVLR